MTAFSFYATKNITSGEGGALTTNNAEWAERIGDHGAARHQPRRLEALRRRRLSALGHHLSRLQVQHVRPAGRAGRCRSCRRSTRFTQRRVALKARLDAGLRDLPEIGLPGERPGITHAYHLYPIIVRTEALTADRDTIMNAIQAENVGIGVHFRAVHLHPYYAETFGFRRGISRTPSTIRTARSRCRSIRG